MIVTGLLELIYSFLSFALGMVDLPDFPASFMSYIDTFVTYIESGIHLLGNYVDLPYIMLLFEIFIGLWLAYELWIFVFWIIRKIPFLGIE